MDVKITATMTVYCVDHEEESKGRWRRPQSRKESSKGKGSAEKTTRRTDLTNIHSLSMTVCLLHW